MRLSLRPRRLVILAFAAVLAGAALLSLLFLVPITHSIGETISFGLGVPTYASEAKCTNASFDHAGRFAFAVHLPVVATGDPAYMTVKDPGGSQVFQAIFDNDFNGAILVNSTNSDYQFCMRTNGVTYPSHLGAVANVTGTLSYTETFPTL